MSNAAPRFIYVLADGSRREIDVPKGKNAMQAAVDANVHGIVGECGGSAMCATCHVYAVNGPVAALAPVSLTEDGMLEATASERRPESRLSCQIVADPALDGLVLQIPENQV